MMPSSPAGGARSRSVTEHSEEEMEMDRQRLAQQQQDQPLLPGLPVWLAASVQQPPQPPQQQPQQQHNAKDCLGCRIVGTVTLLGVSAYTWSQGASLPPGHANRRFLFAFSGVFGVMAAARAVL